MSDERRARNTYDQRHDAYTMNDGYQPVSDEYQPVLAAYLRTRSEDALYRAALLSRVFIEGGLGPEDIVALHAASLQQAVAGMNYREQARAITDAHHFLLEIMIAYSVQYREHLDLRLAESVRDADTRAERAGEQAEEAERSWGEKTELLGVIAHEFGTPLTAARLNLDMIERLFAQGRHDAMPRYLTRMDEALTRLTRLSNDLVEASRDEPPYLALTPQNLTTTLTQAFEWAQPVALTRGIACTYDHDDAPITLRANVDALLSIFGNLLSNAVRYTPEGGSVTVRQGTDGGCAWVDVTDTGIGIGPEEQTRIFEKFYRSPEAKQVTAQGVGLGLALVQQLVTAHDGALTVTSVPGQGSTFRVLLPLWDDASGG